MSPQDFKGAEAPALFVQRSLTEKVRQESAYRGRQVRAILSAAMGQRRVISPVVVFTTSRSGSTWLCDVLFGINQCGLLPEHLRPIHFRSALSKPNGQHQLRILLDEAAALIGDRRYGGTKLIWDYFPELFQAGESSELRTALAPLLDLDPVFLRLRRGDIEAQAVSRSLASQTGSYHRYRVLKGFKRETSERLVAEVSSDPIYNLEQIEHHEEILKRAESHLDASIAGLGIAVHEIMYEQLAADPYSELQPVVASLRPELSAENQARRLQRALSRATIAKSENVEQIDWLHRYRTDRKV